MSYRLALEFFHRHGRSCSARIRTLLPRTSTRSSCHHSLRTPRSTTRSSNSWPRAARSPSSRSVSRPPCASQCGVDRCSPPANAVDWGRRRLDSSCGGNANRDVLVRLRRQRRDCVGRIRHDGRLQRNPMGVVLRTRAPGCASATSCLRARAWGCCASGLRPAAQIPSDSPSAPDTSHACRAADSGPGTVAPSATTRGFSNVPTPLPKIVAQRLVRPHTLQSACHRADVLGVEKVRRAVGLLGKACDVRAGDGKSGSKRLHQRKSPALESGRIDQAASKAVEALDVERRDEPVNVTWLSRPRARTRRWIAAA